MFKTTLAVLFPVLLTSACGTDTDSLSVSTQSSSTIDLQADGTYRAYVGHANPNPCSPIELGNTEFPLSVSWGQGKGNVLGNPATLNDGTLEWHTTTYGTNELVWQGIPVDWQANWTWNIWPDGTGTVTGTLTREDVGTELCTIQLPVSLSND